MNKLELLLSTTSLQMGRKCSLHLRENRHPQEDIRTNEHTILIHQIYVHGVKNVQNIT
jgi:hypothetical protein